MWLFFLKCPKLQIFPIYNHTFKGSQKHNKKNTIRHQQ